MPTSSTAEKNAPKRAKKGAGRAKSLITAAAFAGTIGGWVVCAVNEKLPDVAAQGQSYESAQAPVQGEMAVAVRRVDGVPEAPAAVAVTRSSR